jgi:hypothetical protein
VRARNDEEKVELRLRAAGHCARPYQPRLTATAYFLVQMHTAQTKQLNMIAIKASFVVRLNVC